MALSLVPLLHRIWPRAAAVRDELPIRAEELYSVERLEQYAAKLAAEHQVSTRPQRGRRLLPRLEDDARVLVTTYHTLAEAIRRESAISPAAEWFVDNFHIVEDQLREVREDLPAGYYRELPKLETGRLTGHPRIYALALALCPHLLRQYGDRSVHHGRFRCLSRPLRRRHLHGQRSLRSGGLYARARWACA